MAVPLGVVVVPSMVEYVYGDVELVILPHQMEEPLTEQMPAEVHAPNLL